jgi:hypothetical protein
MGRCKSCAAPITWAKTRTGKSIPLDRDPVPHGNITIIDHAGDTPIVSVGQLELGEVEHSTFRYQSHFSTCPDAGAHRRRR